MPSEPQPTTKADNTKKDSSPGKERLPFEPKKNRHKTAKNAPGNPVAVKKQNKLPSASQADTAIPEAVSRRMLRRMAIFSGVPSSLGIATFIVSYIVISHAWFKLPNSAVVLVSMGFFGLGVLGLSYGVLSASWDEEKLGSIWGWEQFTVNWGRMTAAWRSSKEKN
ncbi:MAG TPA: PAM68 family protein [Leptolyngbyaceae cyanobacterium]